MLIYINLDYIIRTLMIKKILITLITTITLVVNANAASDGELILKKMILQKSKNVGKDLIELRLH